MPVDCTAVRVNDRINAADQMTRCRRCDRVGAGRPAPWPRRARAGRRAGALLDRATFPRDKLCGDTVNPGTLAAPAARIWPRPIEARGLRVDGMLVTGDAASTIEGRYPDGLHGRALSAPRPRLAAAAAGDRRRRAVRAGRAVRRRDRRAIRGRARRSPASSSA